MKEAAAHNDIPEGAIDRFRAALRVKTDWPAEADGTGAQADAARKRAEAKLIEFQEFLVSAYPRFNAQAERAELGPYAVVYRLPGADAAAAPALLLSHYDVVPAEREAWTVDPFGAELKDGFIWARGALDTKNSLICALEAVEALLSRGFKPKRDLYFAFGGDEERSGQFGARSAAAYFADKGIRFEFLVDEGSAVTEGILAGVDKPLALIGVEEKGFLDIELTVDQKPGHASRPPRVQAVAVLARALQRLSKKPFPWKMTPTVEMFFKKLAPIAGGPRSAFLANAKALGPLFFATAGKSQETAALMRTTVAMTQLEGSPADNVLPSRARAILNLRLLPGWTVDAAVEFVARQIADPRVKVAAYAARAANDPVPANPEAASGRHVGWRILEGAIGDAYPNTPVLPFLVTATTDSRHYAGVCGAIYRFSPLKLNPGELGRIHGHDERVSIDNFAAGIVFYRSLISRL